MRKLPHLQTLKNFRSLTVKSSDNKLKKAMKDESKKLLKFSEKASIKPLESRYIYEKSMKTTMKIAEIGSMGDFKSLLESAPVRGTTAEAVKYHKVEDMKYAIEKMLLEVEEQYIGMGSEHSVASVLEIHGRNIAMLDAMKYALADLIKYSNPGSLLSSMYTLSRELAIYSKEMKKEKDNFIKILMFEAFGEDTVQKNNSLSNDSRDTLLLVQKSLTHKLISLNTIITSALTPLDDKVDPTTNTATKAGEELGTAIKTSLSSLLNSFNLDNTGAKQEFNPAFSAIRTIDILDFASNDSVKKELIETIDNLIDIDLKTDKVTLFDDVKTTEEVIERIEILATMVGKDGISPLVNMQQLLHTIVFHLSKVLSVNQVSFIEQNTLPYREARANGYTVISFQDRDYSKKSGFMVGRNISFNSSDADPDFEEEEEGFNSNIDISEQAVFFPLDFIGNKGDLINTSYIPEGKGVGDDSPNTNFILSPRYLKKNKIASRKISSLHENELYTHNRMRDGYIKSVMHSADAFLRLIDSEHSNKVLVGILKKSIEPTGTASSTKDEDNSNDEDNVYLQDESSSIEENSSNLQDALDAKEDSTLLK